MGINMKVMCKILSAVTFLSIASILSFQVLAVEILGGRGNAAEKLILDWANAKPGNKANTVKFSTSISSGDLTMLQNGKIDFAILDTTLSETDLARMNLLQLPFALNGISIVVNLPNTMAGTLRLDSQTLGKIFSGEIANWDDPAITALNPKHDLPNKPITVIHSGELSTDYSVINSYIGNINEKWQTGNLNGKKREWPANSIYADGFSNRISTIKNTPLSIGYLPMQYMPQPTLSSVHIKNRDGNFVGLSDTGIIASASAANIDDGQSASLSLINKSGNASWPISTFSFIVVPRDKLKDEKIIQLFGVISYGLKTGSLKPTVHNYVAIPDKISKSLMAKIETLSSGSNTGTAGRSPPAKTSQEIAQEAIASKKRSDEELQRLRTDPATAAQEESRKAEDKNREVKQRADEIAREQAVKEAKAAKLAAEEAIKAATAAKLQAEQLAEKNRLIAKAEKEKADKEKAEKEKEEKEKTEKERAIQLRNQKDEDPLEAYRRSVK
jgi:phosphate transport system substrate-binding protein